MSLALEQIVSRLEDPSTPVVWLDPSTPAELWSGLPEALARRGLAVINLDDGGPIVDEESLLHRFCQLVHVNEWFRQDLASLKECLLRLPHAAPNGWVVMFRHPDALRQTNEALFEDFLEILEFVHESNYEIHQRVFKLVVLD